MSKPPRGSNTPAPQGSTKNILGVLRDEEEIRQVNQEVEKQVKTLAKHFTRNYERKLSYIESNIVKMTANAEVRLTRTGKGITESYQNYLDKIQSITEDIHQARTKAEVKEIQRTVKLYRKIVKQTNALSKEEKRELSNIIKETTKAAKVVRSSKVTNTKFLANAVRENLPDIAGIITSVFGNSMVPAFIGGVIGDYQRQKREAVEREKERQRELIRAERDYNIKKSLEKRIARDEEMSDRERMLRKYTLTSDTGKLKESPAGLFDRRRSVGGMVLGKALTNLPEEWTRRRAIEAPQQNNDRLKLISGRELSVQARNIKRIEQRVDTQKTGEEKKEDTGVITKDFLGSLEPIIRDSVSSGMLAGFERFDTQKLFDSVADVMEDSVYTGVYDSIKRLADEGIFSGFSKKSEKYEKDREKFRQKEEAQRQEQMFDKEQKFEEKRTERTTEAVNKQKEATEKLLSIEERKKIIKVMEWLASNRADLARMVAKPLFAISKLEQIRGTRFEGYLRKTGGFLYKGIKKVTDNRFVKTASEILRDKSHDQHIELVKAIRESGSCKCFEQLAEDENGNFYLNLLRINQEILYGMDELNLRINQEILYGMDELNRRVEKGITTIPFNFGKYTPKEIEQIGLLREIVEFNAEEYVAIEDLRTDIQKCLPCKEDFDKLLSPPKAKPSLDSKALAIYDKEKASDAAYRAEMFQNSMTTIVDTITRDGVVIADDSIKKLCDCLGKSDETGIAGLLEKVMPKGMQNILKMLPAGLGGATATGGGILGNILFGKSLGKNLPKLGKGAGGLLRGAGGLLRGAGGAIAAGAETLGAPALAVGAAGAVGYGVGTIINKGIDKMVQKLTGGQNQSLGGWLYDVFHPEQVRNIQKTQDIIDTKQEIEVEKQASNVNAITNAVSNNNTVVGGSTTNITMPVPAFDTDRATNQLVETYGA